jgi:hypothetical protein
MIIPQSNVNNAVALTNNGLTIQPADLNDEAQLWNIVKRSNGSYWIKNSNGNYVQSSSSYALSCSNSTSTSGRNFTIDFIDDIHCRISVTGDAGLRSWDLDNQSLNAGTRVGVWQYGNAADADHRNWFLMRVGSTHEKATSIAEVRRSDEEMPEAIYSLSGVRMKSLQRGVNIVRRNGKFIKVVK